MFGMGPWELLILLLVALLLFGAKRLPEIAKGLGKGIREFKGAVKDTTDELKNGLDTDVEKPASNNSTTQEKKNDKSE